MDILVKKTYFYPERDEQVRKEFKLKLENYRPEQLIYMDESGINNNESYGYGWQEKGQRYYSKKPGRREERISIIGALCQQKFFAPMVYKGYCTSKVIEAWLEQNLLPKIGKGKVIVMDNASFHNSKKIRDIIENAGCELLFLPKYSPDLNPIEHWWQKVKNAIKKELRKYDFNLDAAVDAAFQYL